MKDAKKMFGTCGIRKVYANYNETNENFTPRMALELGLALGTFLQQQKQTKVVIGRDVRNTALPIQLALTSGLMSTGCKVYTIGIVATPTLCMAIDYLHSKCGVMITASHNPPEYIGIKIFGPHGLGYSPEQENEIEQIYQSKQYLYQTWDKQGYLAEVERINDTHVRKVIRRTNFQNNHRKINLVMDPGNGSASISGPMLLGYMGCKYITLNSQPDGNFPGRLSEPSADNLRDLSNIVRQDDDFELGIAFDGDADRVVFVDEHGEVVEPIRVLTFMAREFVTQNYPDPVTRKNLSVVTPVNSSGVIEHILEPMGITVYRTKVGDINVSQLMQKNKSFLGGENCGVYIWPEYSGHWGPDSLMAIVILMKYLGQYEVPFSQLLREIPEFPYIKDGLELKHEQIVNLEDYQTIADELKPMLKKAGYNGFKENLVDGLHIKFDQGWILVRKSGTSPIMRVTAESKTNLAETKQILNVGKKVVSKLYDINV